MFVIQYTSHSKIKGQKRLNCNEISIRMVKCFGCGIRKLYRNLIWHATVSISSDSQLKVTNPYRFSWRPLPPREVCYRLTIAASHSISFYCTKLAKNKAYCYHRCLYSLPYPTALRYIIKLIHQIEFRHILHQPKGFPNLFIFLRVLLSVEHVHS